MHLFQTFQNLYFLSHWAKLAGVEGIKFKMPHLEEHPRRGDGLHGCRLVLMLLPLLLLLFKGSRSQGHGPVEHYGGTDPGGAQGQPGGQPGVPAGQVVPVGGGLVVVVVGRGAADGAAAPVVAKGFYILQNMGMMPHKKVIFFAGFL